MFMNPIPSCDLECRFTEIGPITSTALYYTPIYDKYGNNINPDGNTSTGSIMCSTCGKQWTYTSRLGKTIFEEVEK